MKNNFLQRMNKWGISDLGGVRKMSGECRGNVGRGLAWNFFARVGGRSGEMKSNHAIITRLSRNNHLMLLRGIRYAAMLLMVLMVGTGEMWGTDFDITLDQFRTTPISGLVKIDDSNLTFSGGALQLSSGNANFVVSTTNTNYKIKKIVFTTTKAVVKYSGTDTEGTFIPETPGTSFTLNLTASGGTAKITQMVVTLTTSTSETLEALVATAITDGVYTTGSSVITLSTEGGTVSTTSGQEYINLAKSKSTRSLTIATGSSYNIKFIALAFYDAIFSKTISASTGTYTAASYLWTPGATPTNSVTLTFATGNSEGAKIRRVIVGYESSGYTLQYNANGGTGTMANTVGTGTVTLRTNTYTKSGCTFQGWATSQANANAGTVAYSDGATDYSLSADATLYAVWKLNTPTISCEDNTVTISVPGSSTVYYTTDGSTTPTSSSTAYDPSNKPTIAATTTFKAIAILANHVSSDVATQECIYYAPCGATVPGNISKGTASGGTGTITLTAAGEPEEGDTWYWQSAADGTATNLGDGATKDVSEAGTYYIRSYNENDKCWSGAKYVTVAAADLLTAISPSLSYSSSVIVENTLSPTLSGNDGSGSVTYALNDVSPAGSLTINESTGVVTAVTVGGTATVTATVAASGNYASGSATSETITVIANPLGSGHVLTWNITTVSGSKESDVSGGTTDIGTDTKSSTSTYLTSLTNLTGVGVKRTTTGKNSNTGKIETPASFDVDKYVSMTFAVASGYQFTPDSVQIKTVAVSTAKDLKFVFSDASGSDTITKTSLSTDATATRYNLDFTGRGRAYKGTVTVKIYVYGADNTYRLSSPLTIKGTVLVDVAAPTDLAKSSATYNSLTFGWTKATNASTYTATLYSDSGCETEVESKNLGDVNTVTFTGLSASTTYYCKVQSHGDGTTYVADGGTTSAASGATTAEPKVVYLKNTMGWENAYLNFYSASYWDESNGAGNSTASASYISGPIAMSYDSETGMFYYETDDDDELAATIVSFTKDNQSNYGNFNGTEAIYSFSAFEFNKAFVPVTLSDTYTKNNGNTKYYTYTVENVDDDWTGYYLWASGQSWEPKDNEFTDNGDGTLSFIKSLSASTKYQFKINEKNNAWGSATFIVQPIVGRTFASDAASCTLYTGPAGDYTFTINTTTKAVSVSYPSVSHPATGYAYFPKNGNWGENYYIHWWGDAALTAWGSDIQITTNVEICSTDYIYFPLLSDYPSLIVKDNAGDTSNKTGDLSSSGSSGKYYNDGWNSFGHTVTYNANKGTGTMEESLVPCGNVTLRQNTFTRSGWTFAGWNTDKYGEGTSYTDQQSLEGIASDLTLYAQWERTIYLYATTSDWYNGNAKFKLHYWDGSATSNSGDVMMTLADECSNPKVYEATISGGGYDKLLFYRLNPENDAVWNQTVDLDFNASYNMYKLTNMSGGEGDNAYGVFESSYSEPTLTISFAAGDGTGSMSDISSIACEGTAEVPDNGFTAPYGKEFANWTADVDVTADDEEIAAGGDIAVGAELTNITSDITLTAKWNSLTTYTITHSASTNGTYTIKEATLDEVDTDKDALADAIITLAATPSSGYVFDHWTVTETSGGATVSVVNANVSPATFTMPAKAVTVAATFKQMPNVYYYKDEDHYVDGAYKNPEGSTATLDDNQNINSGNEWTVCSTVTGLTVKSKGSQYDGKGDHMNAYIKIPKDGNGTNKYVSFIIASGHKATSLKIKIGGYSSNPTVTLKPLTSGTLGDAISFSGSVAGVATTENNFNELTWSNLAAGTYILNVTSQNAYVSEISAVVEYAPVTEDKSSWAEAFATPPTLEDDITLGAGGTGDPITITIANGETAKAKSITLNNAKLNIQAGGALIVANTISKDGSATAAGDIHLGSDAEHGNAALVMGNYDGANAATVQFYTKAHKTGENNWVNQYIGTPFRADEGGRGVKEDYYGSYLYSFDISRQSWANIQDDDYHFTPFLGYNIVRKDATGTTLELQGKLVATSEQPLALGYNGVRTENLLANSWTAPIHISAFVDADFNNVEKTIYIFNAGGVADAADDKTLAGQYSTYSVGPAGTAVIPSMQSFSVYATDDDPALTLNYTRLVYNPAVEGITVQPNYAPHRAKAATVAEEMLPLKLRVRGESGYADELKIYLHEDFSDAFENGWDAHKMYGYPETPQLYAVGDDGELAISCVPDAENMLIGLKAGTEDQLYTMTFEYNDDEPLYMVDTKTNTYTQVMTGNEYTFQTNDLGAHSRFILTHYAPQMPTDLEPTSDSSLKGREKGIKFIEGEKMFILMNGVLYDATGRRVEGVRE